MNGKRVWVVQLVSQRGCRMKAERDTKYVRAWTEDGAIQVARFHSYIDGAATASAYARLATPEDLGCVKVAA